MTVATPITLQLAQRARYATSAVFFTNGVVIATWVLHIPGVQQHLHLAPAAVGTALLGMSVGSLISMPQAGHLAARYGTRRVTVVAGALMMLALLLPFAASNLWTLFAALMVLGAANGLMDVAMNAQGVAVERELGRPVMSSFHAAYSLGNLSGAGAGSLLISGGLKLWPHVLLTCALTLILLLCVGAQMLPKSADQAPAPAGEAAATAPGPRFSPLVLLLGALCFLGMLGEGSVGDWSGLYSRDQLQVPAGVVAAAYTGFVLAMTLGRTLGDGWRSRFGDRNVVTWGALLSAVGLGLGLLTLNPYLAALGFLAFGLGIANVVPVLYGAAGRALAGRGIAQVATIGYAGFLVGPPLIGFVAQVSSLRWGLVLVACCLLAVGLIAPRVYTRLERVQPQP